MKSEERINKIIDEKEQYQLQAIRLEAENTALKAILTKRDESVTEQTKIILNLEAENKRLKEVIIKALKDTIIRLKKEYDMLDAIIDMKDAVIDKLKAENARLKSCLQEIKRILIFNRRELEECLYNNINGAILDLIVKAESEEE